MSEKSKVFVAGPYNFPQGKEVDRMEALGNLLRSRGFQVYMACELEEKDHVKRFQIDLKEVESADIVVAQFERYTFGTLFECGYAYAKGKPVFILSSLEELKDHPFILGGCHLVQSEEQLIKEVTSHMRG